VLIFFIFSPQYKTENASPQDIFLWAAFDG
jgi:hypothetical protein